jgi:hypothetical protein
MKAGTVLIGHYYRSRPLGTVLGLLLMTSVACAVVFMGTLWPAFRYHHTASAEAARWDVHVNGPLSRADAAALRAIADRTGSQTAELANRGAIKRLTASGRTIADAGDLYALNPAGSSDFEATWAPRALVVRGAMSGPDAVGIDWVTARRVGVRVGDTLVITQVYADPDGRVRAQDTGARVTAVLATTAELRGVVMRSSPQLQQALERSVGVVATDAFFRSSDPEGLVRSFRVLPGAANWSVTTRGAYQRSSQAAAQNAGARAYGSAGLLVAATMLFAFVLRELIVRMTRRRSSLAVLFSLGQKASGLLGAHLLEQTAIVVVVSWIGYSLGIELLVTQVGLFPPEATRATLLTSWLGCVALLGAASLMLVRRRLTERSLVATASDWRS